MGRDDDVVVFGEDVGYFGGVFRCTQGLQAKYGKTRCFDAPISESGIVGTAIGMAAYGLRPCVEIQFADYMYPAYDQITQEAARIRYRSNGDFTCPIVLRMPTGGGIFGGQTHSQSPEALFTHVCGLKVVVPSNPYDAKGLLIAAIEDPDPVMFLEPKRLYNGPFDGHHDRPVTPWSKHELGDVPDGHYTIPIGKAEIRRQGMRRHRHRLWHHGACGARGSRGDRHRRRGDRPAQPAAARSRHDRAIGDEDRALRRRARGDADVRLRRRAGGAGAGALLLPSRSAGRARRRLGHALSACAGMGLFPRTRPASGARLPKSWRPDHGRIRDQDARCRRRRRRGRARRMACEDRRSRCARTWCSPP